MPSWSRLSLNPTSIDQLCFVYRSHTKARGVGFFDVLQHFVHDGLGCKVLLFDLQSVTKYKANGDFNDTHNIMHIQFLHRNLDKVMGQASEVNVPTTCLSPLLKLLESFSKTGEVQDLE